MTYILENISAFDCVYFQGLWVQYNLPSYAYSLLECIEEEAYSSININHPIRYTNTSDINTHIAAATLFHNHGILWFYCSIWSVFMI
jgi:hypothetical protein